MTCRHCQPQLPTAAQLWPPQRNHRKPDASLRTYAALASGDMTIGELRKAAWPDGEKREDESLFMMLSRLDKRLAAWGIRIARIGPGGEGRIYRLVGA